MKLNTKTSEEDVSFFDFLLMIGMFAFLGWIFLFSINSLIYGQEKRIKEKFGGYPAEILQPVTLKMLPSVIDKDTKGIVFIKHGCLNASKDEIETLRDKNSSDKEMYIIGGQPVKIELKLCGE